MNRLQRGLIGAAIGSLSVVVIHPGSRPFLLSGFQGWGRSSVLRDSPYLIENLSTLPKPATPLEAELWMEAAATELRSTSASRRDIEQTVKVCDRMHAEDSDNAYWLQMKAVFLDKLGHEKEARAAWLQASNCARWDNLRALRNTTLMNELQKHDGRPLAWHAAAVYRFGSHDEALAIKQFADMTREVGIVDRPDLEYRFATLENGRLMRDGSKLVETGSVGAAIVELASYPVDLTADSTPRKMLLARTAFIQALDQSGSKDKAGRAAEAYQRNEGWLATMPKFETEQQFGRLGLTAMLAIVTPGTLFLISLVGANFWAIGVLMRRPRMRALLRPSITPIIGVVLGGLIWTLSGQLLAGIAIAACIGFLAYTPPGARVNKEPDFGPAFSWFCALFGAVFAVLLVVFLGGMSTPAREVLISLREAQMEVMEPSVYAVPAAVLLALLLLTTPGWAYGFRVSTGTALALTLRTFGKGLFVGCLALSILATPIAAVYDLQAGQNLRKLATNEPVYYFLL